MKKVSIYAGIIVIFAAVFTQLCAAPGYPFKHTAIDASFAWEKTVYDFGAIKRNVPVSHKFSFTNNGDTPLVISSVQASCGCTVTDYSKDPIPPGATGYVSATYNAASLGVFNKSITVNANIEEGAVQLTIKGVVKE